MIINRFLIKALVELDDWLRNKKLNIELDIVGGIALHLHKIDIQRATMDIDLSNEITNKDVLHQIKVIGRGIGLDETWIEFPGVPLPSGSTFETHKMFSGFRNIEVRFLSLEYLVLTKIAAYYDRKHIQATDAADIEAIMKAGGVFNAEILEQGIEFIRESRQPVDEKKIQEVRDDLSDLF